LVTGVLPFDGKSAPEVMTKVLREEAKPIAEIAPDVPPSIIAFIVKTLSKDPAFRPQSASAFIVELEDAFNNPTKVPASAGRGSGGGGAAKHAPRSRNQSRPDHQAASAASGSGGRMALIIALIVLCTGAGVLAFLHWLR
jgi:serine/threonine protein kinase